MNASISQTPGGNRDSTLEGDNKHLHLLIDRACEGDLTAFDELYARTSAWLLGVVRRIVRDGQAEDVLADVYIQVWDSLGSYDYSRSLPRVWLAMIARSRALDHLRREKKHGAHEPAGDEIPDESAGSPEQILSDLQQRHRVHLCLEAACLTSRELLVIGLAYFHESTQQEIATVTGLPLGTVKSLIWRAQNKIRAEWSGTRQLASALRTDTQAVG